VGDRLFEKDDRLPGRFLGSFAPIVATFEQSFVRVRVDGTVVLRIVHARKDRAVLLPTSDSPCSDEYETQGD